MILDKIRKKADSTKRFSKICTINKLTLNLDENINELSILSDIFENREYADYFPFYKKATIIDIGSHFGYFSLFSSLNTNNQSKIIAIEPEQKNFNQLKKNIASNTAIENIVPLNCAIGVSNEMAKLFTGKSTNNSIITDYSMLQSEGEGSTQEIEMKTLEQIMIENKISEIDFLKMDCEGAEFGILENMSTEVLNKIKTISMEFHDLKSEKYTGEFIVNILYRAGFSIVKYKYEKTSMGLNYGKIIGTKIFKA